MTEELIRWTLHDSLVVFPVYMYSSVASGSGWFYYNSWYDRYFFHYFRNLGLFPLELHVKVILPTMESIQFCLQETSLNAVMA